MTLCTVALGKLARAGVRVRGGGSALPGLLVERLDPLFLRKTLDQLRYGVVLVSGTNGKTTTTKIVAELLEGAGLRVLTNRTGSNFVRGVISTILESIRYDGHLPFDVAVLELDEAHAIHFVKQVAPRVSLLLNVMRDQLDRFGEIDYTAKLLATIAEHTTEAVVLNRDDPLIRRIAPTLDPGVDVHYFGVGPVLQHLFPVDDQFKEKVGAGLDEAVTRPVQGRALNVELANFRGQEVAFRMDRRRYRTTMSLTGVYNFLNAAAALAVTRALRPDIEVPSLLESLARVTPAPGRGERLVHHGRTVEFVLVKNPPGFRVALIPTDDKAADTAIMIVVNDRYADGRDTSWLWDVDFSSLREAGVDMVAGTRADDVALRLQYDCVRVHRVAGALAPAFQEFLERNSGRPMRIYCTYTAMVALRTLATKTGLDPER